MCCCHIQFLCQSKAPPPPPHPTPLVNLSPACSIMRKPTGSSLTENCSCPVSLLYSPEFSLSLSPLCPFGFPKHPPSWSKGKGSSSPIKDILHSTPVYITYTPRDKAHLPLPDGFQPQFLPSDTSRVASPQDGRLGVPPENTTSKDCWYTTQNVQNNCIISIQPNHSRSQ